MFTISGTFIEDLCNKGQFITYRQESNYYIDDRPTATNTDATSLENLYLFRYSNTFGWETLVS